LEGEIQLRLVDAWDVLNEAVELTRSHEFGRSFERQEWVLKLEAVRGCVLLAAARLIDVHHVEALPSKTAIPGRKYTGHAFAKRRARTKGESAVVALAEDVGRAARRFETLCPFGFPSMEFGLGRLARWIEERELVLMPFFGVGDTPGRQRARERRKKCEARGQLRKDLAGQDAAIEAAGRALRQRAGVE
jgi:hypothetical protein